MNRLNQLRMGSCLLLICVLLTACSPPVGNPSSDRIPNFDHVVWIVFENRDYDTVIGSADMPFINALAEKHTLLSDYTGIQHPSLPNYLALIGGDTFGVNNDCIDCFIDQPSLPDLIESAGLTWKTYQEDMPSACFVGNADPYVQKHNPFAYFDAIRLDAERCQRSVVPLSMLEADLAADTLPNFAFITPNLCHSGHDCDSAAVDQWLADLFTDLQDHPALGENSLIVVTYDEGKDEGWMDRLLDPAGGQVVTILVSPLAKPAFKDDTPYNHYSLLKTLLLAWDLPDLANTKSVWVTPITQVWK